MSDRDTTIVARRRAGESFPSIAKSFGKSGPWAWAIVKRLAPDLLGRKAKTGPQSPRVATARTPRPTPTVDVQSTAPRIDGFTVRTTVQDVRRGSGIGFAHGVDAKSNAVIFTCTLAELAAYAEQIDAGRQPEVDVPGHLLVRYDGATGAWANPHAAKGKA